jgi:hypothetical protein
VYEKFQISEGGIPREKFEAFWQTLLAESDPRPGHAGEKVDEDTVLMGYKKYRDYELPCEK